MGTGEGIGMGMSVGPGVGLMDGGCENVGWGEGGGVGVSVGQVLTTFPSTTSRPFLMRKMVPFMATPSLDASASPAVTETEPPFPITALPPNEGIPLSQYTSLFQCDETFEVQVVVNSSLHGSAGGIVGGDVGWVGATVGCAVGQGPK